MDGIFNINKPTAMTSHDVVAIIRKHLKQKRVGHAGTLDPLASGVLPICVGQATRVAEYLSESGKAYQADINFGTATDTYDAEGTITATASTADLTLNMIQETLEQFRGPQMQNPPLYSAIKIQGQPAYKRARAGEVIVLERRPIVIHSLEILEWIPPRLTLAIECSKGTYIRSLAHDLGMQLGCCAYLEALVRTRSGPFTLSDSITLEQFADAVETNSIQHYSFPLDKALEQYPAMKLDVETAERIKHGNIFNNPVANNSGLARVYDTNGAFIAIAEWNEEQQAWQPKKVFASD
ncbi:MAG TPA: tRNA pseudouridine(55) synthase TruB [Ktedonobacteraceae bacterium]|nr:tRNA pseudouridine(55) synthase TruB [Ktedonobacteraceae bacterium]